MRLTRMAVISGLLVVAFQITGCRDQVVQRSSIDNNIKNAKLIAASLKETFSAGRVEQTSEERGSERDGRFGMLQLLIRQKFSYMINSRVTDPSKRSTAQAKLTETVGFMDSTLVPKYTEAFRSKKPEDAKALVPLLDELDKHLDELNGLLQ